jgi:hypothetical protein
MSSASSSEWTISRIIVLLPLLFAKRDIAIDTGFKFLCWGRISAALWKFQMKNNMFVRTMCVGTWLQQSAAAL